MTLSQCETESMMFLNGLMRISLMKSDLGAQSFGKHFSRQVMNKFFPCYRLLAENIAILLSLLSTSKEQSIGGKPREIES